MTKAAAIYQFWASFGLPAYEEGIVPTGENAPEFPYITYSFAVGSFGEEVALSASTWHRSTSLVESNAKAEEIKQRFGNQSITIDCDGGKIRLRLGTPNYNSMSDPSDELIRRKAFNVIAEFNTRF